MKALFGLALGLFVALACSAQDPPKATKDDAKAKQAKIADMLDAKVYDEKADAKALIEKAVTSAKRENRRVLIQWGGNWCGWCLLLDKKFKSDKALAKALRYEYDVVHIDSKNADLIKKYGADVGKHGVPFLTVLDGDGKVVVNHETESFETKEDGKNGHDATKLLAFLTKHQAEPKKAADVLAAALAEAAKTNRKVFLHFGAPWCGWCLKLDAWLVKPETAALMGKDFVDVKIDQDRMPGAKEVFAKYNAEAKGGIPWFVILDANGKALATSDGAKGNVGFPYEPEEIAHFVKMLNDTRAKLTDKDVAALKESLTPPAKK